MNSTKHLSMKYYQFPISSRKLKKREYSLCEAIITPIAKPHKDIARKEKYRSVLLMNINAKKILNNILAK